MLSDNKISNSFPNRSWLSIHVSFRIQAFDESKNRSMTSVSTLQELGSQMMEFYSNTFGFVERYRHIIEILIEMNS